MNTLFLLSYYYTCTSTFVYCRTGALRARLVRLVQSAKIEKTRGLVKSFKESFGFIERADIVGDVSHNSKYIYSKWVWFYLYRFSIDILSLF